MYLCLKAGHWMYGHRRWSRARPFIERLESLLAQRRVGNQAICALEAKGLIADFEGDLNREIFYKRLEVKQLLRLLEVTTELPGHGPAEVLEEMKLLALLLADAGRRATALNTAGRCASFAEKHRLDFSEGDIRKVILE